MVTALHKQFPPITRTTLALYAGASGDHNPVHIDSDVARSSGFPDVFAPGMLGMAYLGRLLTDIAPADRIRSFTTRFHAITKLGDILTGTGTIEERIIQNGEERTRIRLELTDQSGEVKLAGHAMVAL
nr:MaoC/PaaZ C-terminal domain-containing protein [Hephaestia sp. MAHUQ-44]